MRIRALLLPALLILTAACERRPTERKKEEAAPPSRFALPRCSSLTLLPQNLRFQRAPAPVLAPGAPGAWDSVDVLNPSLVFRDGRYIMLYSGFDGRVWRTGPASSKDGRHWEKLPGPVLEPSDSGWDSEYIAANGSVLLRNGKFYYWYQGGRTARIGLATSEDGRKWSKHQGPVLEPGPPGSWDSKAVADPYVLSCGDDLFLYYLGQDRSDTQRLGVASSRDGIRWTKYPGNPVLGPGPAGSFDERGVGEPAVLPLSSGLAMFYTGRDAQEFRRIGLALSSDGVSWRKGKVALDVAPQSRVATASRLGDPAWMRRGWDSRVVADPHVLVAGETLSLWYGGGDVARPDENLHGHIGLATAPVEQGHQLEYTRATVAPDERRTDTPNGHMAFPYPPDSPESSVVTLARAGLIWTLEVPSGARLRASVRMPLAGADPALAVVRVNKEEILSRPALPGAEVDLDLARFAGQRVELELAAKPGTRGERASWVQWRNPRIVLRPNR